MPDPRPALDDAVGHTGLLRTPSVRSDPRITRWVRSARARGQQVVTVAVPDDLALDAALHARATEPPALSPAELHPTARPTELVRRALDGGHRGLGVLVSADGVMASSSPAVHVEIEHVLEQLCRHHPVSVLCLYDRPAAGSAHVAMAVAHHPGELHDAQSQLRHTRDSLHLSGEFDITNLDVLGSALQTLTAAAAPTVHIDLSDVRFLSVASARELARSTARYRDDGGRVEVSGASAHVGKVLRMLAGGTSDEIDLL